MTERNNDATREITSTRVFAASRALVWRAMTDPTHLVQWWGPRGFTTTVQEMDVRPGGAWLLVMHGPDGVDYPNQSIFTEVIEPERLSFSHGGRRAAAEEKPAGPKVDFEGTWLFEALGPDQTRVTVRMVFRSTEERNRTACEYGAVAGLAQTLDRLDELLARR